MLREFQLRRGGDGDVGAKHNGARGCGALIDGQHIGHGVASRVAVFWCRNAKASGLEGEGQYHSGVVLAKAGTHTPKSLE